MNGQRLLEVISERVVIGDGAVGTQLVARGVPWSSCLDELNLTQPHLVLAVHYEYRAAGAEVLETNTFGANRYALDRQGLAGQVEAICAAGVSLARQAAGQDGFVLGSIGPIGRAVVGRGGSSGDDELTQGFSEVAAALAGAGADALLLETFVSVSELRLALAACRAVCDLPVMCQFSLPDRKIDEGLDDLLRDLLKLRSDGAAVLGGNCGFGPLHLVQALGRLAQLTDLPLSAYPNASFPEVRAGRFVYNDAVDYFLDAAEKLVAAGVTLLGGCCGTTPEHIRGLSQRLAGRPAAVRAAAVPLPPPSPRPSAMSPMAPRVPDLLEPIGREPLIVVELDAPRDMDYQQVLDGAVQLAAAGVHGISIAENPLASIRMSSVALSYLVQRTAGIPAVCHITCRDRNLLGQQSELMGAAALGVNTILALTGDPITLHAQSNATAVFDTNSFGLIEMLGDLNEGRNALGLQLSRRTGFTIGVAFDPGAKRLDAAVRRLQRKIERGAHFAMSQMVYDTARMRAMYETTAGLDFPILAGIMPLVSARNARFLHNEVPGMRIPEAIQERMAAVDGDREASTAAGLAIATEAIDVALAAGAPGIYLVTPFGRVDMMLSLVSYIKSRSNGLTGR